MATPFGTPEWAAALEREINASSEYRNAAASWGRGFDGDVLLVFEADPRLPRTLVLWLGLAEGRCTGAEFIADPGARPAGFALRAKFGVWIDLLERRTVAATAILTGKMRVDGDRLTLLRHTAAHRALVHCAASLDTLWPTA
jgi:putative sterol carrier protein